MKRFNRSINEIKAAVFALSGAASTKEIKQCYPNSDLRHRDAWLNIEIELLAKEMDEALEQPMPVVAGKMEVEAGQAANRVLTMELRETFLATRTWEAVEAMMDMAGDNNYAANNIVRFRR